MSQPRNQYRDTRREKGRSGGAALHPITVRGNRTPQGDLSALYARLPDRRSVVVAKGTPSPQLSAIDTTRTPPGYLAAANSNITLAARLSLGSNVNGPGLVQSPLHQLMGIGAVRTPPSIAINMAPTFGMDSSRSLLIAGQDAALCSVHPIALHQSQLVQTIRQQQRHQQALLSAAGLSSRAASLPHLSTNVTSHAQEVLDTAIVNIAMAPERLMHPATLQNMSARSTQERLASALHVREGALSPERKRDATLVAEKPTPYSTDASSISESLFDHDDDDSNTQDAFKKSSTRLSSSAETFPFKLNRMLEEAEMNGDDNIVSFFPHGRAFAVHSPRAFVSKLMPKYFSTTRMPSFQRQLNLYGFQRITDGKDKGGYFHEYFLRGQKHLCKKIRRKTSAHRRPTTPDSTEASMEEEFQTETHSSSFVAANRTALDQVILAQLNQQEQQHNFVATIMPPIPQEDLMSCLVEGIGRPAQPRLGMLGPVADVGRLESETVANEELRSDLLHPISVARQLQHQAGGNDIEQGASEGVEQSEDSTDLRSRIKKRHQHH